jgi:hypothetical protein
MINTATDTIPFFFGMAKKALALGSIGGTLRKSTNFSTKTGIMNPLTASMQIKLLPCGSLKFSEMLQKIPDSFIDGAFRQFMQGIAQPFVHAANRPV